MPALPKRVANLPHGKELHSSWKNMKQRCNNPNDVSYSRYGARGITVCSAWDESFYTFYDDMVSTYFAGGTVDRIDGNGNYEPSNCRWATRATQAQNRTGRISAIAVNGVRFHKQRGMYAARTGGKSGERKTIYWGPSLQDAINARKEWEAACC